MQTLTEAKQQESKQRLLDLLAAHHSVSEACHKMGLARQTFYNWMDSDDDFRRHVRYAEETVLSQLHGYLQYCCAKACEDPRYQRSLHFAVTRFDRHFEKERQRDERARALQLHTGDTRHPEEAGHSTAENVRPRKRTRTRRNRPSAPHPELAAAPASATPDPQVGHNPERGTRNAEQPVRTTTPVHAAPPVPPQVIRTPSGRVESVILPVLTGDVAPLLLPDLHPLS